MPAKDVGLALLVVLVWGINFVALRLGLNGMPPMLMVASRFVLSALPAIFFLRRPRIPARYVWGYALFIGIIQFTLMMTSLKLGMPTGLSSILVQTQAFFTLGVAALALGERIHGVQVLGMLISLAGLVLIGINLDRNVGLLPLLLLFGSAASWGTGNVITRAANAWAIAHGEKLDMLAFTIWGNAVPAIPMFALSLLFEGAPAIGASLANITPTTVLALMYTAYGSTMLGYVLWNKLIGKYGASQIAPFSLLVPIVGMLSTAFALGERIAPVVMAAGVIVMLGLTINVFGRQALTAMLAERRAT